MAEDDPLSLKDRGFRAEKEGRDEEALAFYDRAAVLYRAAWESQTTPVLRESQGTSLAIALQHGVTLEIRRRQWDAAARRLEETLSVWRSVAGGAGPTASLLGTRAMVQRAQGHLPEAWASITEALATAEAAHVAETWPLHGMAGRLARARGDATGAEAAFRQAITNVETLRGRLTTDETKIAFFGTPADLYEEFVAFLMDTQRPEAALEIAEKARARALLDGVGGAGSEGEGFAGETPSPASAPTVSAADALALARARDTAFLVYFLTRAKLYVWLLTPQGRVYSGAQVADPASVAQAVQALREPLVFGESFEAPRRALNDLLTGPVAAALDALPPASRLSIVPHKILAQVPFAMLGPTPGAWAEAWSLTVLPSLSVGAQRSARPLPPDGPLLAVGYSTAHRPLPAVAGELKAAAALYPGATVLSEADATASRLRAELPHYPLILIAAHSARRPGAPGDVGQGEPLEIVLSGSALTSRDLKPGLTPRAGLVILSACETLQGVQVAGDELLNLARAFLIAGAERVLLTQWEVEDAATATLVPALLAGVREGQSPAWALHNAVQAYRLAHANDGSAAWAAWILVGPHD
ncbi:CHAT domain-containing protein [Pararhodospirillum photometricum]|uniref:Tetratricopeptide TPR_2 repeat protein n=1 Tax=Pararhodospirillum photometricum DSM 122 TaxID=1150469 RepID=H6SPD6_PARPM|nr:CHAT domain-containing protein [Pararhodospirillum photometricum]CCG09461.1 Tetratricopeptide TPR_2 repeat protein [Pararhodospirillum photometricum DSM 122]